MKKTSKQSIIIKMLSAIISLSIFFAILCGILPDISAEIYQADKQITHNALYTTSQIEEYNYKDWGMPQGERVLVKTDGMAYLQYVNPSGYAQARTPVFDEDCRNWNEALYLSVPVKNNTGAIADFLPMFFVNESDSFALKAGAEIIYQTGKYVYSEPLPEATGTLSYISIPQDFDGIIYIPVFSDSSMYEPVNLTQTEFDITGIIQMGTYFRDTVDLMLGDYRLMYSAPSFSEKQITNISWLNQEYVYSLLAGLGTVTWEGEQIHIVKPSGYTNGLLPWHNAYNTDFTGVKYVAFEVDNSDGPACNILPSFNMVTENGEDIFSLVRTQVVYCSDGYKSEVYIDNGSLAYVEIPAGFKGIINMSFSDDTADYARTWTGAAADTINISNITVMRLFMNEPAADFRMGDISISYFDAVGGEKVKIYNNKTFTEEDISNGNNTPDWGLNGTKTRVEEEGVSYININADGGRAIYPLIQEINRNWTAKSYIEFPVKNRSESEAFIMPYFFIGAEEVVYRPGGNIKFYLSDSEGIKILEPTNINDILFATIPAGFEGNLILPISDPENDYEYYWGEAGKTFDLTDVSRVCIEVSGKTDVLIGDAGLTDTPLLTGVENGKTYTDTDLILYTGISNGCVYINYEYDSRSEISIQGTGSYYVSVFGEDGLLCEEYSFQYVKTGDISGDGIVNTEDIVLLKKHLLGQYLLEGPYKQAADSSGVVDIRSLIALKKMMAY